MGTSTSVQRAETGRSRRRTVHLAAATVFWLAVWQLTATVLDQPILLVSPVEVLTRLAHLVVTTGFWTSVGHTFARISLGFLAGAVAGVLGAGAAATSRIVEALLAPLMSAIRSTPVVSFVILVLIWFSSSRLTSIVSLLMVLPIIYSTVLEGIRHRDATLQEMTRVFAVPWPRRFVALDVPEVLPYLVAGCQSSIGLAWKSGVAAEVIGLPGGTIGERLYQAKIFLSTADLFAWTLVVVLLAFAVEKFVVTLLRCAEHRGLT